jgi:MerR family mercuric resistance operon transcriptional regulator
MAMTIGQAARQAGVGVETVRFYERKGLIDEPPRPGSGYRQYSPDVVTRIQFIKRARQLGFSLKEIQELLLLRVAPETTRLDVKRRTEAKIAEIERKIEDLSKMKQALVKAINLCGEDGPLSACPILEALDKTPFL